MREGWKKVVSTGKIQIESEVARHKAWYYEFVLECGCKAHQLCSQGKAKTRMWCVTCSGDQAQAKRTRFTVLEDRLDTKRRKLKSEGSCLNCVEPTQFEYKIDGKWTKACDRCFNEWLTHGGFPLLQEFFGPDVKASNWEF